MKMINKVLIALAIAGMGLIIVGFAMGGNQQLQTMYENKELSFGWHIGGKYYDVSKGFKDINNLDIDIDISSVIIKEYTGSTVKVEGNVRNNIIIEQKGDTLVIKEKGHFSIGFFFFDGSEMTVYIPQETTFNNVNLEVDTGEIIVNDILMTDRIKMHVDAGKIEADKIICNKGSFGVNVGKISIDTLDSQQSEFDVDVGKISADVVGEEEDYSYNVKCDVGSVTVGNFSSDGISTKDSGGRGERHIEAKCDVGSITIRMKGE